MQIFGFLGSLLGYVLWGAFYLLKDFGLSIIVFTIIVRLCMFPFTIKQQKSMAGTARLSKKQNKNICSCNKVLTLLYYRFIIDNRNGGTDIMRKSISISIRVSEDELEKFKEAARLEAYASYSEFVRRTALIEATRIIKENNEGENTHEHN